MNEVVCFANAKCQFLIGPKANIQPFPALVDLKKIRQILENSETRVFEWAESYPKYEKPEERIPPGLVSLIFKAVGIGIGGSSGEGLLRYRGKDYPFTISRVNLGDKGVSAAGMTEASCQFVARILPAQAFSKEARRSR